MSRTTHGHHIPGTELDENAYTSVSICGGPYGCGQCIEETRKTPKHGGEIVDLFDDSNPDGKAVGWVEVDSSGRIVGDMIITNMSRKKVLGEWLIDLGLASKWEELDDGPQPRH